VTLAENGAPPGRRQQDQAPGGPGWAQARAGATGRRGRGPREAGTLRDWLRPAGRDGGWAGRSQDRSALSQGGSAAAQAVLGTAGRSLHGKGLARPGPGHCSCSLCSQPLSSGAQGARDRLLG
jgi:hypothetical protein